MLNRMAEEQIRWRQEVKGLHVAACVCNGVWKGCAAGDGSGRTQGALGAGAEN